MVEYKDFLRSAVDFLHADREADEVYFRNSVSRAYYGLYHLALGYADSIAIPPVSDYKGPTHEKLSSYFEGSLNADKSLRLKLRGLGYSLKQCHRKRCKADYLIEEEFSKLEAEAHLLTCENKVGILTDLSKTAAA